MWKKSYFDVRPSKRFSVAGLPTSRCSSALVASGLLMTAEHRHTMVGYSVRMALALLNDILGIDSNALRYTGRWRLLGGAHFERRHEGSWRPSIDARLQMNSHVSATSAVVTIRKLLQFTSVSI